ncbi:MAG: macro domain-containing protein [Bacteroidota bacterium]
MITYTKGDLFDAHTEAIINTVNTVGVMGKGIALQFKDKFPLNYNAYRIACENDKLQIGNLLITECNSLFFKYIINFPTKKHWRHPSQYEYIEKGLAELVKEIRRLGIKSVAVPPLGTGNGKLEWEKVKNILEKHFSALPEVKFVVFEPQLVFERRDNMQKTSANLTPARTMLLEIFHHYEQIDSSLNLLVTQKIAYFLQRFGEPLRLNFNKGWYGPYAPNLNKVLQALNGTFINYKAQYDQPSTRVNLIDGKKPEVDLAMQSINEIQKHRVEQIKNFIAGFETPFSLEIIATVDWIMQQKPDADSDDIYNEITNWTKRKATLIKQHHVDIAYKHLIQYDEILGTNIMVKK